MQNALCHGHPKTPQYGDFTNINDYHSAMNATAKAREAFHELPAEIRSKFDNDPGKYVDFCLDENNLSEMKEMGLLNEEAVQRLEKADEEARIEAIKAETIKAQGGAT